MRLIGKTFLSLALITFSLCAQVAAATPLPDQSRMIERYQNALQVDPDNSTLHYFLGVALIREGQIKDGIKELRIAYPAYTDSVEMQYNMGLAYSQLGDPDSAMIYLEQAEALGALETPDVFPMINAYYNVGLTYLEDDDLEEAESVLRMVLKLDASRVEVYRLLGDIAARSGRDQEAQQLLSTYLEHYPDDQSAKDYLYALYFNQALKQFGQEEFAAARASFLKAYDLSPGSPLALYYLGSLDYNAGELVAAVDRLKQAYPNAPEELRESTRSMLYNCALQLVKRTQWDNALFAMEPLVDGERSRIKDLLLAGNINLQKKQYSEARELYLKVLEREPTNAKAVVNLTLAESGAIDTLFEEGRQLFLEGAFIAALNKFDTVLSIQPNEHRSRSYRQRTIDEIEAGAATAFDRAESAIREQDYLTAINAVNEGLAMQPDSVEGLNLKRTALAALEREMEQLLANGFALLEQNDLLAAEAQFKKILTVDPENERAEEGLHQVEQRTHDAALAAVRDGNAALDNGKIEPARTAFNKALRMVPELPQAQEGIARLESLTNSMVLQEIQWGRRAVSAGDLDQAKVHFNNALALRDSKEIRKELAAVEKARNDKSESLLAAARQARSKKDFTKARSLYRRLLAFAPDHAAKTELAALETEIAASISGLLATARNDLNAERFEQALAAYREALDLDPANRDALAGLKKGRSKLQSTINSHVDTANQALAEGDFKSAETSFRKALSLDPYNRSAKSGIQRIEQIRLTGAKPGDEDKLYLSGIEHYTKGKYAEAVAVWEKVLVLDPDYTKAKMNIEKAKRKLVKIKEYQGG